jgi:DNA mismatch repair ATPase MutS
MRAGELTCLPVPLPPDHRTLSFTGLYNVTLSLHLGDPRAVGNDLDAGDKSLLMITGANQGGKSTFLRSIGLAQLMTQCGMFVGAESFHTNLCRGLFTHFKREEDTAMRSGKLDEELHRMSEIADHLGANSMVLFNESFAATNEREGSQIARQILRALLEARVKVAFVTHLYDLAHSLYVDRTGTAVFLRPERRGDGRRTFKLAIGEPLPTSYGEDLYHRIFGADRHAPADSTT